MIFNVNSNPYGTAWDVYKIKTHNLNMFLFIVISIQN